MPNYLFAAGLLAIAIGLTHSVLGELLIFRHLRKGGIIPTEGGSVLKERHVRIIWASWHVVTVFGIGFGTILLMSSFEASDIKNTIGVSMLVSSVLVFVATNGKHPGWLGLLIVALLTWLA